MKRNLPQLPWWVWVAGIYLLLQVGGRGLGSIAPLLMMGFIFYVMFGRSARLRQNRPRPGEAIDPVGTASPPTSLPPHGPPPQGRPVPPQVGKGMPRIDVPSYPGSPRRSGTPAAAGSAGRPALPAPSGHPALSPYAVTPPVLPPAFGTASMDPAVTLGRMQIAQAGRDLAEARDGDNQQRVGQVLTRLSLAVDQVRQALAVSSAGDRASRSAVDKLRSDVAKALDQGRRGTVDAALAARIAAACDAMGQTGRHE